MKYGMTIPPMWIHICIVRESGVDLEGGLQYWRKNHDKYLPESEWEDLHEDAWNKKFDSCEQLMCWYRGWSKYVLDPAQQEEKKRQEEEEMTRREKRTQRQD